MKKQYLFVIVLLLTLVAIISIILLSIKPHFNSLIVNENKWENIISNKFESNQVRLDNIEFDDYQLIIDEDDNKIYYSSIDSLNQYNPKIKYKTKSKNSKLVINNKISDSDIKLLVYDDTNYHIYNLIITDLPYISITYIDNSDLKKKSELKVFDNRKEASQRIIKSSATVLEMENEDYQINLKIDSLGNNRRKNEVSLFGNEVDDEFILRKKKNNDSSFNREIELFINNKYQGVYGLEYGKEREKEFE